VSKKELKRVAKWVHHLVHRWVERKEWLSVGSSVALSVK
jgi:hypothetical protein